MMIKLFEALSFIEKKVEERQTNFGSLSYLTKADNTSLQSDLSVLVISPELLKSNRNLVLSFIGISTTYLNSIQFQDLRERYFKIASKRNWQGFWLSILAEMLKIEQQNTLQFLEIYFKYRTYSDFYGNDFKIVCKSIIKLKYRNPYLPSKGPVKRPQRKRGYNDKGHLPSKNYSGPRKEVSNHYSSQKELIESQINLSSTPPPSFFEKVCPELNVRQETLVERAVVLQSEENKDSLYTDSVDSSSLQHYPEKDLKQQSLEQVLAFDYSNSSSGSEKESRTIQNLMVKKF